MFTRLAAGFKMTSLAAYETLLAVTYGSKTLELSKGKTAVEVGNEKDVVTVLDVIIRAVQNSELDTQIEAASVKLRDGFKK